MPIRFSKSGSPIRSAATTLAAFAGLWFSSVTHAQTQPPFEINSLPPQAQRGFNQQGYRSAPLSSQTQQPQSNDWIMDQLTGNRPRNNARQNPVAQRTPTTVTETVNLNSLSHRSIQSLVERPAVARPTFAPPKPQVNWQQAQGVVTEKVPNFSNQRTAKVARPAASPFPSAPVATASYFKPASEKYSGVHQLKAISIKRFEQKLVDRFGGLLQANTSDDGRYVRVTLPVQSAHNAGGTPMTMLVDRATGELQYEGAPELKAQWHQFVLELDATGLTSNAPAAPTEIKAEIIQTPQVEQVAFQQDAPANNGTQVQGIPGLKGPVFIARDEYGNLTLTGDPEDVAIVRREVARLSAQADSGQPTPISIPLENAQGNLIQEKVQQIYDASYAQINGPASITATDNPNSLVVVGSPAAANAVRELVQLLDQKPIEGATKDFRTFSLSYISSNDATNRLRTFFGQVTFAGGDTRIPAAPVEVIPDFRSNQVTVKGSQTIINAAADFLRTIDVASVDNGAVNEVRIIQLKNALASDVAFVIQNAINGQQPNAGEAFASQTTGQGGQQANQAQAVQDTSGNQSQLRSAMLSFMTRNDRGELIKSAIMFDVRITADTNSNSLIVTGPAGTIPLIVELVKQLDRIPDAESQIKVFELVYSDAQTIFDMLDTLFNSQNAGGGAVGAGGAGATGGTSNLPLQTGGGSDGASLINLRFSIEPRSNSIIASGPARDLQVIEDLLNRLDARAVNNFPAVTYRLSNAPAQDVADAINSYLEGRTSLIDADPRTATGVPAVNRSVIVVPEVVSNSLIVSALPEYRAEIENIIKSLDRRPPMIQVKVLIAEVDLDAVEEFGVELGIQDSLLFDRGTSIAAGGLISGIGFPFNTATVPNMNAVGREAFPAQALSNLNVGRVNSSLGYGGLVLSAGNESVNVLLRALKDRNCVRVLSSPQLMTLENLQGRVSIGASVARIAGSTNTNFGVTQDIVFQDVGVILEVTPRVSPDGLIVLTVNAENSSVGPASTGTAVGVADDGSVISAQQILKTEATTTLSARSGQTVVFSGLITENKVHSERGVPIISDLPVVGPLFKFESDTASRSELLIIMTPTLVTNDSDLTAINNDATDRMHWCLSDVADVYGSTGFGADIDVGRDVDTYYPDADPTGMMQPYIQNSKLESPTQPTLGNESGVMSIMEGAPEQSAARNEGSATRSARKTRWSPFRSR